MRHRRPAAGTHQLSQDDAEQGLGILLRESRRERYGRHSSHQGERRDDHGLAMLCHRDQAVAHRLIEASRAVDRDDGQNTRTSSNLLEIDTARNRHHAYAVERASRPDCAHVKNLVEIQEIGSISVQMPGVCG